MVNIEEDPKELEKRYLKLVERKNEVQANKATLDAELAARRRNLKKIMDNCVEAGYDPDNLQDDIRKTTQVLKVKIDSFEAEIEAAEKVIRPMMGKIS